VPAEERAELFSGAAGLAAPLFGESGLDEAPAGDVSFAILHGLYWLAANAALSRPTLLLVDDVHWADAPSLRWLSYVARRLEGLPEHAPLPIKIAVVRTLQEALSNATRHGEGRGIQVSMQREADALRLSVEDHGPGFDPQAADRSGHLGLAGMRERAEVLGGSFEVVSAPGAGTAVMVRLPLTARVVV